MDNGDIVVITVILSSVDDYKFTRYIGFSIQDYFFKTLAKINSSLAKEIHDDPGIKPYSLTTLFKDDKPVYTSVKKGERYWFKITLLDERIKRLLLNFVEMSNGELELDIKRFNVDSYNIRIVNYKRLLNSSIDNKFTLNFLTPTCFKTSTVYIKRVAGRSLNSEYQIRMKSSSVYYPLPDPGLMLRNLLRIWKKYSNINLDYEDIENIIAEDKIFVYEYPSGIKTRWAREGKAKNQQGFIGTVTYGARDLEDNIKRMIAALLQLGELTGTGIMRTAGLGTYKILNGIKR